jgi:hypothetical protein
LNTASVLGLMREILESASLIVRNSSEGGEEEPSGVNGLAEGAAELLACPRKSPHSPRGKLRARRAAV